MGRALIVAAAMAVAVTGAATAHELFVFAKARGCVVRVEARFADGRAPASAVARLTDERGAAVGGGPLGADGALEIARRGPAAALRVDVAAGAGHDAYWILSRDDVADAAPAEGCGD